jgi:hypothetical protein
VICLLLAVDSHKALRLNSHHKARQHHNDLTDAEWEDTLTASGATDEKELNQ